MQSSSILGRSASASKAGMNKKKESQRKNNIFEVGGTLLDDHEDMIGICVC